MTTKLGFIGLGIMGKPMAKNLIHAGFNLVVRDRHPERVDEIVRLGAEAADSPAAVAIQASRIILMLPDGPDVEEVILGKDGIIEVANADHPITQGISDWDMTDETYTMRNAGPDSEVLLTAKHPKSMNTIAWTRSFRNCRVFCFQSGHDNETWVEPNFREVLRRGILWSARML